MTAVAMNNPTRKHKVLVTVPGLTTTYRDVSSVSSRPSSRNSTHPTSPPASPTKSFISTNTPLIRPKAKVNSSALRRTSSSHTPQPDSPLNHSRPPSPLKSLSSPITRVRSPPTSTIGVGSTRKSTTARVKASASVTSDASFKAKSPSPELRNRPSTASSGTFKTRPNSRERHDSPATILHHASSFSSLQHSSPSPSLPNTLTRTQGSRLAQSELGIPSSSSENHADTGNFVLQPIKIRSRVSAMVKNANESPELSPSTPSTRSVPSRVRVSSVSSASSLVSTPSNKTASPSNSASATTTTYPITTASPAANPHRYSSSRPTPAASGLRSSFSSSSSPKYTSTPPESRPQSDEFRPFAKTSSSIFPPSPNSNGFLRRPSLGGGGGGNAMKTIDPANVPLPPQSPPTSSLSVSSRSSTSYVHEPGTSPDSPVSFSFNLTSPKRQSLKETLDTLSAYVSTRDGGGRVQEEEEEEEETNSLSGLTVEEDEERKVRAEAKSNRKIADLEITNRSLLAINASLEKTKDRQAKEIRELKRKLRETRLILPPRAYRAVKSSMDPEEMGDDEEDIESSDSSDDNDSNHVDVGVDVDDDDASVVAASGNETARKGSSDETYGRIKLLINNLLKSGRQALEDTKENHMETKGGTKVLTAEEVETWRDSAGGGLDPDHLSDQGSHFDHGLDDFDGDDYSAGRSRGQSRTPQPIPCVAHGGRMSSVNPPSSLPSPQLPPILITEPS